MQISREIFPYIFNPNDGKDIGKPKRWKRQISQVRIVHVGRYLSTLILK